MKTCPACNHQNPADALICESCGDRLEISAVWEKTTIRGTHTEAFAAGYFVFHQRSKKKSNSRKQDVQSGFRIKELIRQNHYKGYFHELV